MNNKTKRDTYLERAEVLKEIEKIKKSIDRIENQIDKIDEIAFDIKTQTWTKESIAKTKILNNKISLKETEIEILKKEYDRL